MYSLSQIASDHFGTFYNYKTNARHRVWPRYCVFIVMSVAFVALFNNGGKEFLDGAVTVQAVLIGFSFNVIFYFASRDRAPTARDSSIEAGLRQERLARLEKEIFFSVMYYNVVAVFCIIMALVMMISLTPQGFVAFVSKQISNDYSDLIITVCGHAKVILLKLVQFLFYLALIEGLYTFVRTVMRIGY
ncbi:hypothetical protein VF07_37820, partial [Nostoc linckia z6]